MSAAPIPWKHVRNVLVLFSPLWVGTALCFGLLGAGYSLISEDAWSAKQPLLVRDEASSSVDRLGRFASQTELKAAQETILEMVQNPEVITAALKQIGPPGGLSFSDWPSAKMIDEVAKNDVNVSAPKGSEFGNTEVIYLSVKSTSPDRAEAFCGAVFENLTEQLRRVRRVRADSIITELTYGRDLARHNLDEALARIRKVEIQAGSDLGELRNLNDTISGEGANRRTLEKTTSELQLAQLELSKLESFHQLLVAGASDPEHLLISGSDLLESQPSLQRLKEGLIDAQIESSKLAGIFTIHNPKRRAAIATEREIKQRMQQETAAVIRAMQPILELERQRVATLGKQQQKLISRLDHLADIRTNYARMDAEVKNRTEQFSTAQRALSEALATRSAALSTNLLAELGPPQVDDSPIGMSASVMTLGSSMAGLVFGLGLVFLVAPGPSGISGGRRWSDFWAAVDQAINAAGDRSHRNRPRQNVASRDSQRATPYGNGRGGVRGQPACGYTGTNYQLMRFQVIISVKHAIISRATATIFAAALGVAFPHVAFADDTIKVDFNRQIRPILTKHCTACHGGVKQAGGVSFVYADQVLPPAGWIIEPGDPEASILNDRITSDDPDDRMPPPDHHAEGLSRLEIELLQTWIRQGAPWGKLWSTKPLHDATAKTRDPDSWSRQLLDEFVIDRLRRDGLTPSLEAAPRQWLRRASFDLTGLPPTLSQSGNFARQVAAANTHVDRDAVYAAEVDRLLANGHFGERWAAVWMDLARYADSKGFEKDPHRDMWPYRDWLIQAFNRDMPYDEFTVKQLAGDLLPNPDADDIIATAFHRNTQTNTEGGTDDEEFRVAAIIDRVNTTWTVWNATTFGCAQCHSHPYDPIKHEDYYACLAMFNNQVDADLDDDYPTFRVPRDTELRQTALRTQLRREALRRQYNQFGRDLAIDANWQSLQPTATETTGGKLKVTDDLVITAGGTFPVGVRYTVDARLPGDASDSIHALRIDILPRGDDPRQWPEQGSLLTSLEVQQVDTAGNANPIKIAEVFVDAITGQSSPSSVLNKNKMGVGEYPELHGPRFAVFVLASPVDPSLGSTFRFVMTHKASTSGNVATPLRKFRWLASADGAFADLAGSAELTAMRDELSDLEKSISQIDGARLPVVADRPSQAQRSTRMFIRGNWQERGDEIAAAIPATMTEGTAVDPAAVDDRLDLARWIVSADNPISARVWANRVWSQLFGIGLVETQEDFGSSGLMPSHPALLDHLAIRLREEHQWRLKPFLRELVLSSTYRQDNASTADLWDRDPDNRLLARGPRTRLSAEMVRDQALRISGLLNPEMGGPSVMPPQPAGVWQAVYSGQKWETASGGQRFRRGLYTYWRRTSPYPSFLMFDSPTRDLCSARRISTNTPLQALVTLNDPVYVECSQALAMRAVEQADVDLGDSAVVISRMFRAVTGGDPSSIELTELVGLYDDLLKEAATTDNAMAIVANTILNLDKALTK